MEHADEQIHDDEILSQLETLLEEVDTTSLGSIDLLTLGSFFNDNEVSPTLRDALLRTLASHASLRRVSLESRVEYVTPQKLRRCRELLGDREVELGIGLESADDHLRNTVIRKRLDRSAFEAQVAQLADEEMSLLAYVLIKPPTISEAVAIIDAQNTAHYVFDVAARYNVPARVAFEPVFVTPGTPLEDSFLQGDYRLANLWSVVEVIRETHPRGPLFVGLSDEGLSRERMPHSCPNCTQRIIQAIEAYNGTQDIHELDGLDCTCRARYFRDLYAGLI